MANNRTLALSDFIIAAIEEACPEVDGQAVYMRGFERFTQHCEDLNRKAALSLGRGPLTMAQRREVMLRFRDQQLDPATQALLKGVVTPGRIKRPRG